MCVCGCVFDCNSDNKVDFITLLAYLGAKYGGDFSKYSRSDMTEFADKIKSGENIESLTDDMKYFKYYSQAYGAALNGMVGNFSEERPDDSGNAVMEEN